MVLVWEKPPRHTQTPLASLTQRPEDCQLHIVSDVSDIAVLHCLQVLFSGSQMIRGEPSSPGSGLSRSAQESRPARRAQSRSVALESNLPKRFEVEQRKEVETDLLLGDPLRSLIRRLAVAPGGQEQELGSRSGQTPNRFEVSRHVLIPHDMI